MTIRYDLVAGLQYAASETDAPLVVLKGDADITERVVRIARRFGIPVVEEGSIAEASQSIPLDTEIPESLYRTVAVVLRSIERTLAVREHR